VVAGENGSGELGTGGETKLFKDDLGAECGEACWGEGRLGHNQAGLVGFDLCVVCTCGGSLGGEEKGPHVRRRDIRLFVFVKWCRENTYRNKVKKDKKTQETSDTFPYFLL
jgi:hypothetical protein